MTWELLIGSKNNYKGVGTSFSGNMKLGQTRTESSKGPENLKSTHRMRSALTVRRPEPRTCRLRCENREWPNTPPASERSPRRLKSAGSGSETRCSFVLNKLKSTQEVSVEKRDTILKTTWKVYGFEIPFQSVTASNWCNLGCPSFPEPPVDHLSARETKATRSGEFASIKLNSLTSCSVKHAYKRTYITHTLQNAEKCRKDDDSFGEWYLVAVCSDVKSQRSYM